MKFLTLGIFLLSGCIVAGEAQMYEGGPYGRTAPSAPPGYSATTKQPVWSSAPTKSGQGYSENSGNCVMFDCRDAQFNCCCGGNSEASGTSSCIIACWSTLTKQWSDSSFDAEPDKRA